MGMHITDERVIELARAAARELGTSEREVIKEALEVMLADRRTSAADRMREIAEACAADPGDGQSEIRCVDDLYDQDTGMPR